MMKNLNTFKELKDVCAKENLKIWQVVQSHEAELAETTVKEIRALVKKSLDAMKDAIKTGLTSKEMSISGMCVLYVRCIKVHVRNFYVNHYFIIQERNILYN